MEFEEQLDVLMVRTSVLHLSCVFPQYSTTEMRNLNLLFHSFSTHFRVHYSIVSNHSVFCNSLNMNTPGCTKEKNAAWREPMLLHDRANTVVHLRQHCVLRLVHDPSYTFENKNLHLRLPRGGMP